MACMRLLLSVATLGAACMYAGCINPTYSGAATLPPSQQGTMPPVGQRGNWALIFSDEFDGTALNSGKWVRCYWWDHDGCTNLGNRELQWYLPENVTVGDGKLRLRADRKTVVGRGDSYDFTSGIVTTGRDVVANTSQAKFDFRFGYAEMRARVPAGRGLFPAFWMLPSSHHPTPEIDIMEVLGHKPNRLYTYFHYQDSRGHAKKGQGVTQKAPLSDDWHVFAVDWRPDRIVWYLDGVEFWRYEDRKHIPQERMYLLVNLAVGGEWPGPPDSKTPFPSDLFVDYVRVWQEARQ
jgi:beta-glucanase (GH16 family)